MAIGQKLEDARNRKGISIREASESTKIRGDFLTAFEAGNFDLNLPEVYLRGFIRVYARFLGIDPESAVADLNLEIGSGKNKNLKKSIGKISGTEPIENTKDNTPADSSRITGSNLSAPNSSLKPYVFIGIISSVVVLLAIILIVIFSSEDQGPVTANNNNAAQNSVRETKAIPDNTSIRGANTETSFSDDNAVESILRLAAIGPIERLIISDEGKSPKIFHEFKTVETGWEKVIPFTKGFRCYSSSLQHVRFAVNDGIEKQVNGQGAGKFSWFTE